MPRFGEVFHYIERTPTFGDEARSRSDAEFKELIELPDSCRSWLAAMGREAMPFSAPIYVP